MTAAYRRVYDSRHVQADCKERSGTPRWAIEYGLPLPSTGQCGNVPFTFYETFQPKIIKIQLCLLELQLKMSGILFYETQCSTRPVERGLTNLSTVVLAGICHGMM